MRILVVEDDKDIRESLKAGLEARCFSVDVQENGTDGFLAAKTNYYDLLILDYMMPGKSGKEIAQELRSLGKVMPIVLLSVQSEVADKVEALNMGADDYLTKPFVFDELLARIRALLRRGPVIQNDILSFGDLSLCSTTQRVSRGNEHIYLTRKEFMLLECLLRYKGSVVTRSMLLDHVWDSGTDPFSNTIEAHILSLRRKIEKKRRKIIHTVPGRGYKIDVKR